METQKPDRRLAAILLADVVGYSRMMERDEQATLDLLNDCRALFREHLARWNGRIINAPGDSILAEFSSVSDAVLCAERIQQSLRDRNERLPAGQGMTFRIGINLGDVIVQGDEIYGDGVNIAARLQANAAPGCVCVSGTVYDSIQGKVDLDFRFQGRQRVKNIATPIRVYEVRSGPQATGPFEWLRGLHQRIPSVGRAASVLFAAIVLVVAVAGGWWWLRPVDPRLVMPSGPVIAVLPFRSAGEDPGQALFSDGITEELITELSRYENMFVLSRNCTFPYRNQSVDVRVLRKELDADYVLSGTVRRAGDQIRVSAEFVDASDGRNLWAETYNHALTPGNLFSLQSDISRRVVGKLGGTYGVVYRAGMERAQQKLPEHLTSYECVLQARHFFGGAFTMDQHALARACLERAITNDPNYGAAWAWLAGLYAIEHGFGYNADESSGRKAMDAARKAVALAPDHVRAHAHLALAMFLTKDPDYRTAVDATLRISSIDPEVVALMGYITGFGGDWALGRALLDKSIALTPNPPALTFLALSHRAFLDGDNADALEFALKANLPGFYGVHVARARSYARMGKAQEAASEVASALALFPQYSQLATAIWQRSTWNEDDAKRLLQGDREAGFAIHQTSSARSARSAVADSSH